jgi:ABC-2 type transport system ATP-binding protein
MSIRVNQLLKTYGEQKAVNNISFEIGKGEIVGFLGPNGAGKSTTMKIITGYLQADAGTAEVCNINVRQNPLEAKRKIGYLPESNALYYEMFVKEYLAFIASLHKVPHPKKRVQEVIQQTGLTVEQNKKIGQLSKGYKQRVGLAATLLHDPEVLILDEPTSGLDPNQIIEIREVIKLEGSKKTVLFSSHILQEVEAICDRVIIINKGKIVANDRLTNLQKGRSDTHVVIVQFKEAVPAAVLQQLKEVAEIKELSPNNQPAAQASFKLETSKPDETRKQILQLALQHNLNIVSLQDESQSLEEVFKTLTQI